ncbi:hypothetical protein PIB30_019048 [Stylosanthes scabra]|uniref:Uncharacterized protein n=1 Tax=Stylosanthes scabra TaxID=79078 RepID=A0ABU6S8C1_9FABA|nr:hypothetical protein [Stylosanthes scabra]
MKKVEERAKVQAAELESCRSALAQERKKVESLTQSLKGKQTTLDEAEATGVVRHLNPAIDYSMITLDTRWDPKAKKIYNPKAEIQGQPEPVVVDQPGPVAEEQPKVLPEQQVEEVVAGEDGRKKSTCYYVQLHVVLLEVGYEPSSRDLASFDGAEFVGAFSERFDHLVGALPVCS